MKRKVKSVNSLLQLFAEKQYTREDDVWFNREENACFLEEMFQYCSMEIEFAPAEDSGYDVEMMDGHLFKEEWLEPIEEEIDFSVSSFSTNRLQMPEEDIKNSARDTPSEHTSEHYNTWYKLTPEDIERGEIKVDSYFVSHMWKLGEKDNNSCVLFHVLKTLQRIGKKGSNSIQREIDAIKVQADNLARFVK